MGYDLLELSGKVAVVIGGTSGIGRAISHGLAEAGADVVPTSRRLDQVDATSGEIEQRGRKTIRVTSDVSDRASLERLLAECVAAFGKVDILICAGRTKRAPTLDLRKTERNHRHESPDSRACQCLDGLFSERGYGRIVNTGRWLLCRCNEVAVRTRSKAAVALYKIACCRMDFAGRRGMPSPGVFSPPSKEKLLDETERGREFLRRTPMGRFGSVKELAGAAIFLASDSASFVTGEVLVVDGGLLASGVNQ